MSGRPKKTVVELSYVQLTAAAMLAEGQSNAEVARKINKSKSTITKWLKIPEFVERIDSLRNTVKRQQTATIQRAYYEDEETFRESVKAYKDTKFQAYNSVLRQGLSLLNIVGTRTKELDPEDIKVNNIAPLVAAGTSMVAEGFKFWDEYLQISYYRRSQFKELDAVMQMCESNVYPIETQRKINDAFLRCQSEVMDIVRNINA